MAFRKSSLMELKAADIQKDLEKIADPKKVPILQSFFKTGKGQYAEGDKFLGIKVPDTRKAVKAYQELSLSEIERLLHSPWHEVRLAALILLTHQSQRGTPEIRQRLFDFYLANSDYINNWDFVDLSTPQVLGAHLYENRKRLKILHQLAISKKLWERRMAILATFYFIRKGECDLTIQIAENSSMIPTTSSTKP